MAVLKAIVSLCRTGEGKPIERYKTRVKVAEDKSRSGQGLMFRRTQNGKPAGHTNLLIKAL